MTERSSWAKVGKFGSSPKKLAIRRGENKLDTGSPFVFYLMRVD